MTQEPQDGSIPNQQEQVREWNKVNGVDIVRLQMHNQSLRAEKAFFERRLIRPGPE